MRAHQHTFGRRLRAAGVSFEDRQDLLGHRSGRITTHYSAAELGNLLTAANQVVGEGSLKTPANLRGFHFNQLIGLTKHLPEYGRGYADRYLRNCPSTRGFSVWR